MAWYQVQSRNFTAGVRTDDNDVIVETAPILRKFIGQPMQNLRDWWPVHTIHKLKEKAT